MRGCQPPDELSLAQPPIGDAEPMSHADKPSFTFWNVGRETAVSHVWRTEELPSARFLRPTNQFRRSDLEYSASSQTERIDGEFLSRAKRLMYARRRLQANDKAFCGDPRRSRSHKGDRAEWRPPRPILLGRLEFAMGEATPPRCGSRLQPRRP
jgi:hypothetical protein